ncbi:MAG: protoporphyrinogen oxidase [Acidobacteriota bacterium]
MQNTHKQVIVLGAGISGLVCAYRLKTLGVNVALIEKSNRAGGVIQSQMIDNYLIERGPNSTRGTAEFLSLVDELGLTDDLIEGNPKAPAFVFYKNKMREVPMGPPALIKTNLLSFAGKLRLFKEPFVSKREATNEESVYSFFSRRLGIQVAERLVAPFVSGIYAGDEKRLSVQAAFPMLAELESGSGSLFRGGIAKAKAAKKAKSATTEKPKTKRSVSFRQGLSQLTQRLAEKLGEDFIQNAEYEIQFHTEVSEKQVDRFTIHLNHSDKSTTVSCEHLIFATPAYVAAELLEPHAKELRQLLTEIEYPPVATLHLAYEKSDFPNPADGFGVLAAPVENLKILGCLFSSSLFSGRAPENKNLFTVFMGGARTPELVGLSDDELVEKAHRDLQTILGVNNPPQVLSITRWSRAIPQYNIGHAARMHKIKKLFNDIKGLHLIGNYLDGVSISDCAKNAEIAANAIAQSIRP